VLEDPEELITDSIGDLCKSLRDNGYFFVLSNGWPVQWKHSWHFDLDLCQSADVLGQRPKTNDR
jgi:hypothetical protein